MEKILVTLDEEYWTGQDFSPDKATAKVFKNIKELHKELGHIRVQWGVIVKPIENGVGDRK